MKLATLIHHKGSYPKHLEDYPDHTRVFTSRLDHADNPNHVREHLPWENCVEVKIPAPLILPKVCQPTETSPSAQLDDPSSASVEVQ